MVEILDGEMTGKIRWAYREKTFLGFKAQLQKLARTSDFCMKQSKLVYFPESEY